MLPPVRGAEPLERSPGSRAGLRQDMANMRARNQSATQRPNVAVSGLASYTNALTRYNNQGIHGTHNRNRPISRVTLMNNPSAGSLEFINTNSTQTPNAGQNRDIGAARRSHVASNSTMRTLVSPLDMMGKNTAEKWFEANTRMFYKVKEGDDDIPFYERPSIKRRKETIDFDQDEEEA